MALGLLEELDLAALCYYYCCCCYCEYSWKTRFDTNTIPNRGIPQMWTAMDWSRNTQHWTKPWCDWACRIHPTSPFQDFLDLSVVPLQLAVVRVAVRRDWHSVLEDFVSPRWDSEVQNLVGKVTGNLVQLLDCLPLWN